MNIICMLFRPGGSSLLLYFVRLHFYLAQCSVSSSKGEREKNLGRGGKGSQPKVRVGGGKWRDLRLATGLRTSQLIVDPFMFKLRLTATFTVSSVGQRGRRKESELKKEKEKAAKESRRVVASVPFVRVESERERVKVRDKVKDRERKQGEPEREKEKEKEKEPN